MILNTVFQPLVNGWENLCCICDKLFIPIPNVIFFASALIVYIILRFLIEREQAKTAKMQKAVDMYKLEKDYEAMIAEKKLEKGGRGL